MKRKQVIEKEAYTSKIEDLHRDLRTEQRVSELTTEAEFILSKRIIEVDQTIKVNWFQETNIMKQFTEQLRKWTNSDIAFLNAGLIIDEFPAGEITYRDVHRNCPHPINPCVIKLTGKELKEVIEIALSKPFMVLKL